MIRCRVRRTTVGTWLQVRTRFFAVYLRFGRGAVTGDAATYGGGVA